MIYEKFDDWFEETERFATRGERFFEEFETMDVHRAVEWLKACWECAKNEHQS